MGSGPAEERGAQRCGYVSVSYVGRRNPRRLCGSFPLHGTSWSQGFPLPTAYSFTEAKGWGFWKKLCLVASWKKKNKRREPAADESSLF